jgi:hypothetical protein
MRARSNALTVRCSQRRILRSWRTRHRGWERHKRRRRRVRFAVCGLLSRHRHRLRLRLFNHRLFGACAFIGQQRSALRGCGTSAALLRAIGGLAFMPDERVGHWASSGYQRLRFAHEKLQHSANRKSDRRLRKHKRLQRCDHSPSSSTNSTERAGEVRSSEIVNLNPDFNPICNFTISITNFQNAQNSELSPIALAVSFRATRLISHTALDVNHVHHSLVVVLWFLHLQMLVVRAGKPKVALRSTPAVAVVQPEAVSDVTGTEVEPGTDSGHAVEPSKPAELHQQSQAQRYSVPPAEALQSYSPLSLHEEAPLVISTPSLTAQSHSEAPAPIYPVLVRPTAPTLAFKPQVEGTDLCSFVFFFATSYLKMFSVAPAAVITPLTTPVAITPTAAPHTIAPAAGKLDTCLQEDLHHDLICSSE